MLDHGSSFLVCIRCALPTSLVPSSVLPPLLALSGAQVEVCGVDGAIYPNVLREPTRSWLRFAASRFPSSFTQIQGCDAILARMQEMLLGFQADLGGISDEIKHLQVKN